MEFTPAFQPAQLIKRYKRFLTDIVLKDGSIETIHCPNTGSMKHCLGEHWRVWYSTTDNPKRKYKGTFELIENDKGHIIGVNTGRANLLVKEALLNGVIEPLSDYRSIKAEQKFNDQGTRFDFFLSDHPLDADCFVEVKSVTLLEDDGLGYFPDAVSTRGQKHLMELIHAKKQGFRSVLLFCVQHTGIQQVAPASHIDPEYADLLKKAHQQGVEILAYSCHLSSSQSYVNTPLPVLI